MLRLSGKSMERKMNLLAVSQFYTSRGPNKKRSGGFYLFTLVILAALLLAPLSGLVSAQANSSSVFAIASNDDFNDALEIPQPAGEGYLSMLDTTQTTTADDDPVLLEDELDPQLFKTVWYKFTPKISGYYSFESSGGTYPTEIAVFSGKRGSLTLEAQTSDSGSPALQSSASDWEYNVLEVELSKGAQYWVEVAACEELADPDQPYYLIFKTMLNDEENEPPAAALRGDQQSEPVLLPESDDPAQMEYQDQQAIMDATSAADDPLFPLEVPSALYNTIWYQFTPELDGLLKVDTLGSDYDTVLAVWSVDQAGALGSKPVAWNDNAGFEGEDPENALPSYAEAHVLGGTTYRVEIASKEELLTSDALIFNLGFWVGGNEGDELVDDLDEAQIDYDKGWSVQSNENAVGGTWHQAKKPGAKAVFSFSGTNLDLFYNTLPKNGSLLVKLDNKLVANINQRSKTAAYRQHWSLGGLPDGEHTLTLINLNSKPSNLDAIVVHVPAEIVPAGALVIPTDLKFIEYSGFWSASDSSPAMLSSKIGDTANLVFDGSQVRLNYQKARGLGKLAVFIDGKKVSTLNENAKSPGTGTVTLSVPAGEHKLVLKHLSGKVVNFSSIQID
jgi:hypothetical protein